jgi:hypothetical protein
MIMLCMLQILNSPNLGNHVPISVFPMDRVAQLYPQVPGSHSIASCDSKGYVEGTRTPVYLKDLNSLDNTEIQFVPHMEHIASLLYIPTG